MLVFVPLFIALGLWQLERAADKQDLAAAAAAARAAPAVHPDAHTLSDPSGAALVGRVLVLRGRYEERVLLLDNQVVDGVPGYAVHQPFRPEQGPALLVNRGWIGAPDRAVVPAIPAAQARQIAGTAHRPWRPALRVGGDPERLAAGVFRVPAIEPHRLGRLLGLALAPVVVHLEPGHPDALRPLAPPPPLAPDRHRAYAVQWFAFAVALVVIYVLFGYLRQASPAARSEH